MLEFARSGSVDAAGNFTVTFVPPGTKTLRSYGEGKLSVMVTDSDVTGQNVELVPAKTEKKDVDWNDLLKP